MMNSRSARIHTFLIPAFLILGHFMAAGSESRDLKTQSAAKETLRIVPSMSAPSLKNGETVTVSALVTSPSGVVSVSADMGGLEFIQLQRMNRTHPSGGELWSADWRGHDLEEKVYTLEICAVDGNGVRSIDRSLKFSDPAAGITTAGTTSYANGGLRRASALDTNGGVGEAEFACSVIDPSKGYAYFGSWVPTPGIAKISLNGNGPPIRVGGVRLGAGQDYLETAVIDPVAGYAYFGTHNDDTVDTAHIIKIALGAGDAPPTEVGTLSLTPGESHLHCVCIDTQNGYAYFGGSHEQGRIIKIALNGSGTPVRIAGIQLNADEKYPRCAVIDVAHGYAYFGLRGTPGRVVKVALGAGALPPVRVGAVTLNPGEDDLNSAVIDTVNGFAYFGTDTATGRVIKVALGGGNAPPVRVDAVTLNPGEGRLRSAVIDVANGYACFGTSPDAGTPSTVVKIGLGGTGAPVRLGALQMEAGDEQFNTAVIDSAAGYAYWGCFRGNGRITKVALTQRAVIKATKMTLSENAEVTSARLYSHSATGKVRLSIYKDGNPKTLVWESGEVTNTTLNDVINVPIASGTPATLSLTPGTYWLGWQVDSIYNVPSFTPGAAGEGFTFTQDFGPFPATLDNAAITTTSETYTQYIVYNRPGEVAGANAAPTISSSPTATPNPAHAGSAVLLSVAAEDADFDVLTYAWNFGDGTNGSGASNNHTYSVEGTYNASVSITDGKGGTATGSVTVTVISPSVGGGADTDGDGFSDSIEIASGSDPNDPTSTPMNNDRAQQPRPLDLKQVAIKLNFASGGKDSIAVSGTLPIAAGFQAAGQKMIVDVGGVVQAFTLDAKGGAKVGKSSLKLSIKAKKGVVAEQTSKFAVKMMSGTFATMLADEGLTGAADAKSQSASVKVSIIFDGMVFQAAKSMLYTAKAGKTGSAK